MERFNGIPAMLLLLPSADATPAAAHQTEGKAGAQHISALLHCWR